MCSVVLGSIFSVCYQLLHTYLILVFQYMHFILSAQALSLVSV